MAYSGLLSGSNTSSVASYANSQQSSDKKGKKSLKQRLLEETEEAANYVKDKSKKAFLEAGQAVDDNIVQPAAKGGLEFAGKALSGGADIAEELGYPYHKGAKRVGEKMKGMANRYDEGEGAIAWAANNAPETVAHLYGGVPALMASAVGTYNDVTDTYSEDGELTPEEKVEAIKSAGANFALNSVNVKALEGALDSVGHIKGLKKSKKTIEGKGRSKGTWQNPRTKKLHIEKPAQEINDLIRKEMLYGGSKFGGNLAMSYGSNELNSAQKDYFSETKK